MPQPSAKLTLLFDGDCPFCRREIEWLRRRDRTGNLDSQDIAAANFDPARFGLTGDEVSRALHAVTADGVVLRGMDAVRGAYRAVGMGWVLAPTRWPLLRLFFDLLYTLFARNRVRLGGLLGRKCAGGSCEIV